MEFEWDVNKAAANVRKHGVSFDEAKEVFGDAFAVTGDDVAHSATEPRERTVGRSGRSRVLVVISTKRAKATRIISARKAMSHEVKGYEKAVKDKLRGG